ncbi:MAG TPA: serine/threonine-protein kinase [Kofleriaceae bacterium]|nr:serine/threonine-protein kinase [Kofleriaceae bacterium]
MSTTKIGLGTDTLGDAPNEDPATSKTAIGPSVASSPHEERIPSRGSVGPSTRESAPTVGSGSAPVGQPSRGDSIGRFVVLGLLGSGGMGNVYSAYDPHLDRKVAIKLLHAEIAQTNAANACTRLLREAQAMAKINHPNVIDVHETGTFGEQVYVAMEFADAGTLRSWLKAQPRPLRDIVELFVQAGRGLAAAHAAGLVHRDFKPDNVLLAKDGSVRVTDFGLVSVMNDAAATKRAITADPLPRVDLDQPLAPLSQSNITPLSQDLTRTGSIMGTPSYMSPEQFTGGEATAQTDQFAFCVALYEALYRQRPFAGDTYTELSTNVVFGEVRPPPKGAKVPAWLRRMLLRGLARKPEDRHPSMNALLAALARDPARRRRTAVAVAMPIAVVAAAGALYAFGPKRGAECSTGGDRVGAVWNDDRRAALEAAFTASKRPLAAAWFASASRQLDAWTRAWQDAYTDACEATRVRGDQSEHLLDLRMQCLARRLDDTRATIDQIAAGGPEAIDKALDAVHALPSVAPCNDTGALLAAVPPPDEEVTRARVAAVRSEIGDARALEKLGRYKPAAAAAEVAMSAARATGYAPAIAEAGVVAGQIQYDLGNQGASDTLREALHVAAQAGDDATMLDAAAWLVFTLSVQKSEYAGAQEIAGLAEAVAQHAKPPVEKQVRLEEAIAMLEFERGHSADSQARLEKALALAAPLGDDHEATLTTLGQLATVLMKRGKLEDARKAYERVLASRERTYGKDHPDVATALNDVGNVYRRESKYDDAKRVYQRALEIRIAALGPNHPEVGTTLNNLGTFYGEVGDRAQAKQSYERALAIWQKTYGDNSVELVPALANLGQLAVDSGDFAAAHSYLERSVALMEAAQGKDGSGLVDLLTNLGALQEAERDHDKALATYQRAQKIAEKAYGSDNTDVADLLANEAVIYKAQKKLPEAAELESHVLHVYESHLGADHPRVGMILTNLASLDDARGDHKAALAAYQRSLAIFEAKFGKDHSYVSYPLLGIGQEIEELQRPADAVPYYERAIAIRTAAHMRPDQLGEARLALGLTLGKLPGAANRARAKTEVTQALAELQQGGGADNIAEAKHWLATHR